MLKTRLGLALYFLSVHLTIDAIPNESPPASCFNVSGDDKSQHLLDRGVSGKIMMYPYVSAWVARSVPVKTACAVPVHQ